MVNAFATEDPIDAVRAGIGPDGQTVDEHPPPQLRVMLAGHLLERMDFPSTFYSDLLRDWDIRHQSPVALRVPFQSGQEMEFGLPRFLALGRALIDRFYASDYPSLNGYGFSAVHGLEMSPGLWARVGQRSKQLVAGEPFNDDPRIVLAAGIEAAGHAPGSSTRIARGVRQAVLGTDTEERKVADPYYAQAKVFSADALSEGDVVDAIMLRALLHRPHARRGRGRSQHDTLRL